MGFTHLVLLALLWVSRFGVQLSLSPVASVPRRTDISLTVRGLLLLVLGSGVTVSEGHRQLLSARNTPSFRMLKGKDDVETLEDILLDVPTLGCDFKDGSACTDIAASDKSEWYDESTNKTVTGTIPSFAAQTLWSKNAGTLTRLVLQFPLKTPVEGVPVSTITVPLEISGTLPSELGTLAKLTELRLDLPKLSGPLPKEIGLLSNLKTLWIRAPKLSGPLPNTMANLKLVHLFLDTHLLEAKAGTIKSMMTGGESAKTLIIQNCAKLSGVIADLLPAQWGVPEDGPGADRTLVIEGTGLTGASGVRMRLRDVDVRRGSRCGSAGARHRRGVCL